MSWIGTILDGDTWREEPGTQAARAVACSIFAPICLTEAIVSGAADLADDAAGRVQSEVRGAESTIEGTIDSLGEAAERAASGAEGALTQVSSIAMWGTIALYGILAMIVFGVLLYLAWPFLLGIRG